MKSKTSILFSPFVISIFFLILLAYNSIQAQDSSTLQGNLTNSVRGDELSNSSEFKVDAEKAKQKFIIPDGKGGYLGRLWLETAVEWKRVGKIESDCKQAIDKFFNFEAKLGVKNYQIFVQVMGPMLHIEIKDEDLEGDRLDNKFQQIIEDFNSTYKDGFEEIPRFDLKIETKRPKYFRVRKVEGTCHVREIEVYQRITSYKLVNEHPRNKWQVTVVNFDDVFHLKQREKAVPECCPDLKPYKPPSDLMPKEGVPKIPYSGQDGFTQDSKNNNEQGPSEKNSGSGTTITSPEGKSNDGNDGQGKTVKPPFVPDEEIPQPHTAPDLEPDLLPVPHENKIEPTKDEFYKQKQSYEVINWPEFDPEENPFDKAEPKKETPNSKKDQEENNFFFPNGFSNELNYTVTGKGETTGHILDLTAYNPTEKPISYPGSKVIITRVDSTQFYLATVPPFEVGPGQTVSIPIDGDCGTIYKPPLGDGQNASPVSTWITPQIVGDPPKPGDDLPDTFTPINIAQGDIVATFPGTSIPLGATTQLEESPELLFELDRVIDSVYQFLWEEDKIKVPIPEDRAHREVRQQAKWLIYSIYEGDPYTQEDMVDRLAKQVKDQTGLAIEELPEPVQEQFNTGAVNIFETLTFIGKEAKLVIESTEDIPISNESTEEIPIKKKHGCTEEFSRTCQPPACFDFEMKIDSGWKNVNERAKLINKVRENISKKADITQKEVWKEYNISDNPTSVTAFWKPGNVGGFASAYANTLYWTSTGWKYRRGTESMQAKAEGTSNLTLTMKPDQNCKAFVVGVSKASILASSTAFDAMLGNTFGEDNKDQLEVLKFIKGAGKLAVKFLIERKTGGTRDDFAKYSKDAIEEHFKGKLKEETIDKLQEYLNDKLNNLLDNLGFGGIAEFLQKGIPDLGSLMEEHLGFNPFKLAEELGEKIEEGLEAAFNLAFVSDTYATANGFLVVTVGGKTASAKAHTRITYSRQGTEATSQAMNGTGPNCEELYISDVKPNSLTITTKGYSELTAQAFGNGKANAFLESQQLQVLVGVCICQEAGTLAYELMLNHQWYHENPAASTSDIGKTIEKELIKKLDAKIADKTLNTNSSPEEWRKTVEEEVKMIARNKVALKPACPND